MPHRFNAPPRRLFHRQLPMLAAVTLLTTGLIAGVGCRNQKVSLPGVNFTDDGVFVPPQAGRGLVADPASPIPDVPKPIGFVPVSSRSGHEMAGDQRYIEHVYQGRGTPTEASRFYTRQLPANGWTYARRTITPNPDRHTSHIDELIYEKDGEAVRVRIAERLGLTTLLITLAPQGQLPPPQPITPGRSDLPQPRQGAEPRPQLGPPPGPPPGPTGGSLAPPPPPAY